MLRGDVERCPPELATRVGVGANIGQGGDDLRVVGMLRGDEASGVQPSSIARIGVGANIGQGGDDLRVVGKCARRRGAVSDPNSSTRVGVGANIGQGGDDLRVVGKSRGDVERCPPELDCAHWGRRQYRPGRR